MDLSADESEDESNQASDDGVKVEIKEEKKDEAKAMTLPNSAVFTISLGVPSAADDHKFAILFNDKRVLDGLTIMPAQEIWQLVCDVIRHDPDIPNRNWTRPWITHVEKKSDGSLAFQTRPTCGKCSYKHLTQYCTSVTIQCANCHSDHIARSRTCIRWLEAEDKAHRSYRFPAEERESTP